MSPPHPTIPMSFHLSSWSIKNPVAVIVAFLVLGIMGLGSFFSLGINQNPNIDVPTVMVTISQSGASPTELETQVTKKVEDGVSGINNVDGINSTVTDSLSQTIINFELGTDTNQATNDVRNAIAEIRSDLPADIQEPVVQRLEFAGGAVMTYVVSSDRLTVDQLSDLVDRTIARELANVSGVGSIERFGGVDREIRVDLNPSRLLAYNITALEVNNQIRSLNINLPSGRTELGGSEQTVRTLGSAATVAALRRYQITLPNGDLVPLEDLGTVVDRYEVPRQAAFFNGESVVGFSVLRSRGSTVVAVEAGVKAALETLQPNLPEGVSLNLIFSDATQILASYRSTIDALIIGCILTVITVGIFLRDWRVTLITAMALPLSMIPTFWVMKSLDYTLDGMTLLALALAIGNLVDDAICMIENIDQHLEMGKKPLQAAFDASREIGLAVVTTTATIVAVFLPVAFMGGVPGQFFRPFGITFAVCTMFSTLVATTMTPMLSAYLLKSKKPKLPEISQGGSSALTPTPKKPTPYRSLLRWALGHRFTTLGIAIAFFLGSLQLVPYIPKGLFNSGDTGLSSIAVELPPGSTLQENTDLVLSLDRLLRERPEVESVLADVDGVTTATVYANLVPKAEREKSQQQFEQELREPFGEIPGARVSFISGGAGGSTKDVTVVLKSNDAIALETTANTLEAQMREVPGLVEVSSSASLRQPELVIQPDLLRAADLGVSVQAIASTASLTLLGDLDSRLAKFNLSDRQIPIRVQVDPQYRENLDVLKKLLIPSSKGTLVPLEAVANFTMSSSQAQIDRFNRERQVTLGANLQGLSLGQALEKIRNLPAMNPLPPEVKEEPSGDAEIMQDIFTRFATALGLAILSIYVILVLLYNNFLYPLSILSALPLSIGGALLGLLVTQKELGLFALIGIVLLMGLVTKNAILLVDFTLSGIKEGHSTRRAIMNAGTSRLRPIVMTSISTIAGMLPIALEWGADGEVRSPMAIAVIGGFSTSTLLTLVVVPVLFTYIHSLVKFLKRIFFISRKSRLFWLIAFKNKVQIQRR